MKVGETSVRTLSFTQADFDRFAELSGDDNPIHVDPDFAVRTKFGKTVAHGMLLYSLILAELGNSFPGPGTIQLSQELMFPSPIYVGEEIQIQLEVLEIPEPGQTEIGTNILRPTGEMGCVGKTLVNLPQRSSRKRIFPPQPPVWNVPASKSGHHRGLEVGQKASLTRSFSHQELETYLDLTGDTNWVFADETYAHQQGFQDVLLPGGLLGGTISTLLGTKLPGRGTNWLKQSFAFLQPVHPEQALTAQVEVIRLRPEKDLVNLRTTLLDAQGTPLLDGEALVWVSDLESDHHA